MFEITCTEEEQGLPPLQLLQRRLPAAPASYLRHLLRRGKVCRQGELLAEGTPLAAGDSLQLPASHRLQELQRRGELTIVHEEGDFLVVDKPAGLAVHRGVGHEQDNLAGRLQELVARRGDPYRVAPVHRLDAETSGLVLFAKGRRAAATLGGLFMVGAVHKEYLALVSGQLPATGELTTPVLAKGKWKEAATEWQRLTSGSGFSLLQLRLHSGRTHQLRRQLAAAQHPVAGDSRYGGLLPPGLDRLFLHAHRLAFLHPCDQRPLQFTSPLPPPLEAVIGRLFPTWQRST
ncbi:MAG: RluA family pseudouridine synthase [Desulfuromonadales bacterium]|nr:RluA family pseudouridine synthase [Desulfuromonadales bacterium]